MERFDIFTISCGGGLLGLSPLPGRAEVYQADLEQWLVWAPDVVLSLVQPSELVHAKAQELHPDLERAGIDVLPFPIKDFGVPDLATPPWPPVQQNLQNRLAKGRRVLIHCMGGCGRSGMMALRLLIAAGEKPDVALQRLRSVRPCAIETEAQMQWAMSDTTGWI